MKKKVLLNVLVGLVLVTPFIVSAASAVPTDTSSICEAGSMQSVDGIVYWATCVLMSAIIPFLFAIATAAFIWGVIQFYLNPTNEEKRKKGKGFIVGGLIALFVITSMWGITRIFSGTFGTDTVIPSFDNMETSSN